MIEKVGGLCVYVRVLFVFRRVVEARKAFKEALLREREGGWIVCVCVCVCACVSMCVMVLSLKQEKCRRGICLLSDRNRGYMACTHMYIFIYIFTHTYAYIYIYIYIYIYMMILLLLPWCHPCIYACVIETGRTWHVHICVLCIYMYIYVYTHTCMHIYIYSLTTRHTHTSHRGQSNLLLNIHTDIHTCIHTYTL